MSRGLIFWILMLLWLLLGLLIFWPRGGGAVAFAPLGGTLLQFILFGLLGWQVFGPPVKG